MSRRSRLVGLFASTAAWCAATLLAGCPTGRDIPPPPADDPKADDPKADVPFCGLVFSDPKAPKRNTCCRGPSAGVVRSADVVTACGVAPAAYRGEARDGDACRLYFQPTGGDAQNNVNDSWVMLSHPVIAVGALAPVRPDPLLPWRWKKVPLRDAIGYQALAARDEPGLLERQSIFWAGRGRRIVGLHVSKQVCDEAQAQALLQRAIDAVP